MAKIVFDEPSRTFAEYLLLPGLTTKRHTPDNVSLRTPLTKYRKDDGPNLMLNIPFTSAIMQAVSDDRLAIALARAGGMSFIYCSQPIDRQAEMVKKVKTHKAGFVVSDSNLRPDQTLQEALDLIEVTGHSTIAITEDGGPHSKLCCILTKHDYWQYKDDLSLPVSEFMTPIDKLVTAQDGISISEANEIIWKNRIPVLPILNSRQELMYLVFKKDYDDHKINPLEMLDTQKRLMVGAGINTRDYKERVPALVEAGADVLCIDSSDGYSEWQKETALWIREQYGDSVKVGGGNVVDRDAFLYLVKGADLDFVKVGVGPGSICITREVKGIGRGQASAVLEVAKARDEYFEETGIYVPICSDGGIVHDNHIIIALALGADFVMMGRYFARFEESPAEKKRIGMHTVKRFWGEGSYRAQNWQRYDHGSKGKPTLSFEEGVDVYIPYAGSLRENVETSLSKIKAAMCNCGVLTISELHKEARLVVVSQAAIREGSAHDVIRIESAEDLNDYPMT
ncbi:MAG: IMP dehydrogenase [Bacillota bacterium]